MEQGAARVELMFAWAKRPYEHRTLRYLSRAFGVLRQFLPDSVLMGHLLWLWAIEFQILGCVKRPARAILFSPSQGLKNLEHGK